MKLSTAIAVLLFVPAGPGATSETWSVDAARDLPGNPVTVRRWEGAAAVGYRFSPADRFERNHAPAVAAAPDGTVWVVWAAEQGDSPPAIMASRGTPGNWSEPVRVSSPRGWDMTPALALSGNVPTVAWASERETGTNIFWSRWDGDGFTPETEISSNRTSPNLNPALGTDRAGKMFAVWQGWDGSFYQVYRRRLGGAAPSAPEQPAETDQFSPFIAGGRPYWETPPGKTEPGRSLPAPETWGWEGGTATVPPGTTWLFTPSGSLRPWALSGAPAEPAAGGAREADPSTTYIGYGDSITYGTDGPPMGKCYIPILENILEARFPGSSFTIYNHGYPGCTTAQLLHGGGYPIRYCPGIDDVLDNYPAGRILIMAGTNDISDGIGYETISSNLEAMIDRSRAKGVEPVIATVIPRCDGDSLYTRTKYLRNYIIGIATITKDCAYADPFQAFRDYGDWESLLVEDCIHPVWTGGSQVIAEAWNEGLLFPSPSPSPSPVPTPAVADYSHEDSGDFDGDRTSDIAVFRKSNGLWVLRGLSRFYFGGPDTLPACGDFNGDGTTDVAVFRPANGLWRSRGVTRLYFGREGDWPVPGDYNGWDHTCDVAVFRPDQGLWLVRGLTRSFFGQPGDVPVPGYYHPDYVDVKFRGVFRPGSGLWAIQGITRFYLGARGDIPVPSNYSGTDLQTPAIFRPSTGLWARADGGKYYFGGDGDRPVPGDFGGQGTGEIGIFRSSSGLWWIKNVSRCYLGRTDDVPVTGRLAFNPSAAGL